MEQQQPDDAAVARALGSMAAHFGRLPPLGVCPRCAQQRPLLALACRHACCDACVTAAGGGCSACPGRMESRAMPSPQAGHVVREEHFLRCGLCSVPGPVYSHGCGHSVCLRCHRHAQGHCPLCALAGTCSNVCESAA